MSEETKNNPEEQQENKVRYSTFVVHTAKYKTLLTKKYKQRKPYVPKDPKKMIAFISGTIKKIYAKEGKSVKKGQNLIILEAMKMNNQLRAEFNGKIKSIVVTEGDKVMKDQLLIEFE